MIVRSFKELVSRNDIFWLPVSFFPHCLNRVFVALKFGARMVYKIPVEWNLNAINQF